MRNEQEYIVRCGSVVVKFRSGSNQGDQHIETSNVGSTAWLQVYRTTDELVVDYCRPSPSNSNDATPIVLKRIVWNFETIFEYYCEKLWTPPSSSISG